MSAIKKITIRDSAGATSTVNIGAKAENIEYDNTNSILTADDTQEAIDELVNTALIQVNTIPAASSSNFGKIYQYVGATTTDYTHNYIYECVSDGQTPPTYFWVNTNTQSDLKYTIDGNATYSVIQNATENGSITIGETTLPFTKNIVNILSHAEGLSTTANGIGSHSEGLESIANGVISHSEGSTTTASGLGAHSEGYLTLANGEYSHAEGYSTTAESEQSHSEGIYTLAHALHSHAEGSYTTASGNSAHAEGGYDSQVSAMGFNGVVASGSSSHAEGIYTFATHISSHAEGFNTCAYNFAAHTEGAGMYMESEVITLSPVIASGAGAHAEGVGTSALDDGSHAECHRTLAKGNHSHAEGFYTTAFGITSHAEGDQTLANGSGSHTEGNRTLTNGYDSHAEGYQTCAIGNDSHAEGNQTLANGNKSHAEGTDTSAFGIASHAEGSQTCAVSNYSHAEGSVTCAIGESSHAEGQETIAQGPQSHVEGFKTTANYNSSHAEGYGTIAIGNYSHAEGYSTSAILNSTHAEGSETLANNSYAHAEGYVTTASGYYSHAEGTGTSAVSRAAHAEGYRTIAQGEYSHTEGLETFAYGTNTHAEGWATTAYGNRSHTSGSHTYAEYPNQYICGLYNNNKADTLFEVGNGNSNGVRSNAFEVYANGDINVTGNIKINGTNLPITTTIIPDENLLIIPDGEYSSGGVTVKIKDNIITLNSTLNSITNNLYIKLTNGVEIAESSAPTSWRSESVSFMELGKVYGIRDFSFSGSTSRHGVVASCRDSSGTSILSRSRTNPQTLATEISYIMLYIPKSAILVDYKVGVSITENTIPIDWGTIIVDNYWKQYISQLFINNASFISPSSNDRYTQGMCSDGTYLYVSAITTNDSDNTIIYKYNLSDGTLVDSVDSYSLGHCNSMTYCSKDNKIYCIALDNNGTVHKINTDLTYDTSITVDISPFYSASTGIGAISYNEKRDQFVCLIRGNHKGFAIFNTHFDLLNIVWTQTVYNYNDNAATYGSIYADDDFIYQVIYNINGIYVYTWQGDFVGNIILPDTFDITSSIEPEFEDMTIEGNYVYLNHTNAKNKQISVTKLDIHDKRYACVIKR